MPSRDSCRCATSASITRHPASEPFSALDPALRGEMLQLVRSVCEARSITLLMVSHSLEDAQQIAPRSVVIVDGRVYWDGETRQLLSGDTREADVLGIPRR